MRNKRSAFTLVELLVVIGIIAVLISILLPALGKAKKQAQMVACQSNMKQIGIAIIGYAADNKNYMPQRYGDGGSYSSLSDFTELGGYINIYGNYHGPIDGNGNIPGTNTPVTSGQGGGSILTTGAVAWTDPGGNIGRLVRAGYMGNANVMSRANNDYGYVGQMGDSTVLPIRFCPGNTDILDFIQTHWCSSYVINPHIAASNNPGAIASQGNNQEGAPFVTWYQKITQYPKFEAMACEIMYSSTLNAGHATGGGLTTYNVLFPDGHVQQCNDKFIYKTEMTWSNGTGNTGTKMSMEDDLLDILECECQNQSPTRVHTVFPNIKRPNGLNQNAAGVYWPRECMIPQHGAPGDTSWVGTDATSPVAWE